MYDADGNGWIDLMEMTRIVKSIYSMMGPKQVCLIDFLGLLFFVCCDFVCLFVELSRIINRQFTPRCGQSRDVLLDCCWIVVFICLFVWFNECLLHFFVRDTTFSMGHYCFWKTLHSLKVICSKQSRLSTFTTIQDMGWHRLKNHHCAKMLYLYPFCCPFF